MPRVNYTVDNIVEEIRYQIDEQNRDSVSTEFDILPTINRAQDFSWDILSRKYPDPILKYEILDLNGTDQEYNIAEDAFEDRVEKIEIQIPSSLTNTSYRELQRISYRDISNYETTSKTNVPYYYCIVGRKIRFVPAPSGQYNARVWTIRTPEQLCLSQGRINILNAASNYVILDSAGDSLTTEVDQLGSYVNLIDGQTGEIKGTLQVQVLTENKVVFRTTPIRTTVLNRTVSGSLSSLNPAVDDYLSPVEGTCVPFFSRPTTNFIIQYAVAEITRKLGGQGELEETVLKKFEEQIEKTWVGREITLRVKKRSHAWTNQFRRTYYD